MTTRRTNAPQWTVTLLAAWLYGCQLGAADHCPPSVSILSRVASQHAGWSSAQHPNENVDHQLAGVAFSRGKPERGYLLKPRSFRIDPDSDVSTAMYEFGQSSERIWLICRYVDTRETLTKPIAATRCVVTQSPDLGDHSISCE